MNDEYTVLEDWTDENGVNFQFRDYPSIEAKQGQRGLMLFVTNHPNTDESDPFLVITTFDDSFDVTDHVVKITKEQMLQAYNLTFFHDERLEEARQRRERQIAEEVDKSNEV